MSRSHFCRLLAAIITYCRLASFDSSTRTARRLLAHFKSLCSVNAVYSCTSIISHFRFVVLPAPANQSIYQSIDQCHGLRLNRSSDSLLPLKLCRQVCELNKKLSGLFVTRTNRLTAINRDTRYHYI